MRYNKRKVIEIIHVFVIIVLLIFDKKEYMNKVSLDRNFFNNFPGKGSFQNTLNRVYLIGSEIIKNNSMDSHKKYIIFDIDNTLLFIKKKLYNNKYIIHPIEKNIDLYYLAIKNKYNVIIITSRKKSLYSQTIKELNNQGILVNYLFMFPENITFKKIKFKVELRNGLTNIPPDKLEKYKPDKINELIEDIRNKKFGKDSIEIVLSVGDQWDDILDYVTYGIKLPDFTDTRSYLIFKKKGHII